MTEDRDGAPGTRNAFFVDETPYAEGSDHDDYDSSTIAVPSLYLRDWPDIYIHTDHDTAAADRPHQAAASRAAGRRRGFQLRVVAGVSIGTGAAVHFRACATTFGASLQAGAALGARSQICNHPRALYEAHNTMAQGVAPRTSGASILLDIHARTGRRGRPLCAGTSRTKPAPLRVGWIALRRHRQSTASRPYPPGMARRDAGRVASRIGEFGPLTFQNDDVLRDRLGADRMRSIKLLNADSDRLIKVQNRGALYAYEIVNFVDGKRTLADIRDAVSGELGPVPLDLVSDYLRACEEANVIALR